ncbi:spore germination protein GerPB [Brevibacillus formosus]|uniref:Spore germination protein GerPB n=1 Tax=Brevibacillus formosus TaxID=54913 RepID=A0ABQ0TBK7_9BACL|nr:MULTISPECIES: spore germination protein GerPB [Brevibacillus]MED1947406.1 spore germination protein GerPB [Brevibacillus formosus]MED1956019.1 spore germination protein GerPB [Brevibacillus formosus]MED1997327.1 spore germination protein GerPB [Brevibacillus formosus]MED2083184.1 spore germination protein GerPB [Brevibacillus formosus]PSK00343.1 spore gernimation protein [Brevibacillus formosus]
MNFFVTQHIVIHSLKIDGISNSSVCQIGSAGIIKPVSKLYNTGGFTEPAPQLGPLPTTGSEEFVPLIPLVSPSRLR